MRKIFITLIIIILAINLFGCAHHVNSCIGTAIKPIIIRWGEYYSKNGEIRGWQLSSNLIIQKYNKKSFMDSISIENFAILPDYKFCKFVKMVQDTLIKVQALNVYADSMRFVEYLNTERDVNLRANWNMNFNTFLSSGFQTVYDSLQLELIDAKKPK